MRRLTASDTADDSPFSAGSGVGATAAPAGTAMLQYEGCTLLLWVVSGRRAELPTALCPHDSIVGQIRALHLSAEDNTQEMRK